MMCHHPRSVHVYVGGICNRKRGDLMDEGVLRRLPLILTTISGQQKCWNNFENFSHSSRKKSSKLMLLCGQRISLPVKTTKHLQKYNCGIIRIRRRGKNIQIHPRDEIRWNFFWWACKLINRFGFEAGSSVSIEKLNKLTLAIVW